MQARLHKESGEGKLIRDKLSGAVMQGQSVETGPARAVRVYFESGAPAPLLVEVTRGGMVESVHRGTLCVSDPAGHPVRALGDIDRPIYPRSAIKPLQALAVIESGAAAAFDLGDDEIALCCASHSGEAMHVERVRAWLPRLGLSEADLECGPQLPGHGPSAAALIRAGREPGPAHNNCSGKHAGMLTTARHIGAPIQGYSDADHPVQRRLLALFEELCALDLSDAARGVDGCGIPVFGVPVRALAKAMARLADPASLPPEHRAAAERIRLACAAHPLLIAGSGRFNSLLQTALGARALVKGGAEGVYMGALFERGQGFCLKIDDGAGRAAECAAAALLTALGVLEEPDAPWRTGAAEIRNWAGRLVGHVRAGSEFCF